LGYRDQRHQHCRHAKEDWLISYISDLRALEPESHLPGYAAWEIHPVMKIAVNE
jgi:hypothetical protein